MNEIIDYIKLKHKNCTTQIVNNMIWVYVDGAYVKHYDINYLKYLLETKQL